MNFPRLRLLNLNNCGFVKGDVSILEIAQYLQVVTLHNTHVSGDVAVFKSLRELRVLCLGCTGVSGSILEFGSLSELEVLDLRRTLIKGTEEDLKNRKQYKCFAFKGIIETRPTAFPVRHEVPIGNCPLEVGNDIVNQPWEGGGLQFTDPDAGTIESWDKKRLANIEESMTDNSLNPTMRKWLSDKRKSDLSRTAINE